MSEQCLSWEKAPSLVNSLAAALKDFLDSDLRENPG